MKDEDKVFIHPYDDPQVIAGQGTIAKEIIDQAGPEVDAVFVAVGGGGLLAGILTYLKNKHPKIKVIAVESEDSACLQAALEEWSHTADGPHCLLVAYWICKVVPPVKGLPHTAVRGRSAGGGQVHHHRRREAPEPADDK